MAIGHYLFKFGFYLIILLTDLSLKVNLTIECFFEFLIYHYYWTKLNFLCFFHQQFHIFSWTKNKIELNN
jgi:hypothetical protein